MRYFVIAEDGNKYGPADIQTLNTWIQEGRILPSTLIEEEGSGARLAANSVAGLVFGVTQPTEERPTDYSTRQPDQQAYWQSAPRASYGVAGSTEATIAWVLGVVGTLLCCCGGFLFSGVGIVFAWLGFKKGNQKAQGALLFNVLITVVTLVLLAVSWPTFKESFERSQQLLQQQEKLNGSAPGSNPFAH